ncbi:uracil phosphoribosyltransferase [Puniceicoccus vermicola]|uniref:Uracil phosphoribosyltransferase n=1 Tax=Puniceicoccus vermicola TaxID=388746 RepID=A0A7X1AWX9_9BACT|nr:uracil phosphoribosyltransferase [Puniceicoccus vermicola]
MRGVTCIDHPLVGDLLGRLRDQSTGKAEYRDLCDRISLALALRALHYLPAEGREIQTPLESTEVSRIEAPVVVVPILRAGLGMLSSFLQLYPDASVGYIGLERDESTAQASEYYCKMPDMEGAWTFLIDPMLATGGSACCAIEALRGRGAARCVLVSILSAPEGIQAVQDAHPDVEIVTAGIDRELDGNKYIRPGLGDFGDRLFGT